ncbi:hypothetical protein KQH82_02830 [bacterium]|nr:hypothetical protein [bacterium]
MYKDVLQSIAGVERYPIVALILFLAAAVLIGIWVIRLRKDEIAHYSSLPLDDGTSAATERSHTVGRD